MTTSKVKFKVGDRIKFHEPEDQSWKYGIIIQANQIRTSYLIEWEDGFENTWLHADYIEVAK